MYCPTFLLRAFSDFHVKVCSILLNYVDEVSIDGLFNRMFPRLVLLRGSKGVHFSRFSTKKLA